MEWQPIETAPRDATDILLLLSKELNRNMIVASWEQEAVDSWRWMTLDGLHYHERAATHWMPLPEPPSA